MKMRKNRTSKPRTWIGIVALALAMLLAISYMPTWAAPDPSPHNQTVPLPTPKPDATKVPTATPSSDDDDDDEDSGPEESLPEPIDTPEPEIPELAPPEAPAGDFGVAGGSLAQPLVGDLLTGEVVVVRLNVREGPGTAFDIVGAIGNGDTVQLLARNEAGTWWALCCVGDAGRPGWVSAQFIKPGGSRADANNALPIVQDLADLAVAALTESDAPIVEPAIVDPPETQDTTELSLSIIQVPLFAFPGDPVQLHLVVTNTGEEDASNVSLRDQLPEELTYVSASADGGATIGEPGGGGAALRIAWPQLAVGETATAIVSVEIGGDLAPGAVVDNLAAVDADNAPSVTGGISVGMVPFTLPDF